MARDRALPCSASTTASSTESHAGHACAEELPDGTTTTSKTMNENLTMSLSFGANEDAESRRERESDQAAEPSPSAARGSNTCVSSDGVKQTARGTARGS